MRGGGHDRFPGEGAHAAGRDAGGGSRARGAFAGPLAACGALLVAMVFAAPVRAQDAPHPRVAVPPLSLFEGRFTAVPSGRLDLEAGSYAGQEVRPGFRSNANVRRAQVGVRGTLLRDFEYVFVWAFQPASPDATPDGGVLNEVQLAYRGIEGATLRVGSFTPLHLLAVSEASFTRPFMESPSMIQMASGLAAGSSRFAAGAEMRGSTWFANAYATAGLSTTQRDDQERGLVGRAALRPFDGPVQFGFSGAWQFQPVATTPGNVRLRDYPEPLPRHAHHSREQRMGGGAGGLGAAWRGAYGRGIPGDRRGGGYRWGPAIRRLVCQSCLSVGWRAPGMGCPARHMDQAAQPHLRPFLGHYRLAGGGRALFGR